MPKNLARIQKAKKRRTQYGGQYFQVLAPVSASCKVVQMYQKTH